MLHLLHQMPPLQPPMPRQRRPASTGSSAKAGERFAKRTDWNDEKPTPIQSRLLPGRGGTVEFPA